MVLISLQSGSSGNCIYVESDDVRLLFDAGLNPTQVEKRLAPHGIDPKTISAIVISHNHSDHVRFAGSCSKKFGVPLYITRRTLKASRLIVPADCESINYFQSGDSIKFGTVTVETVCTPHDATDGVVFAVDDGKNRLGIATDVGHVFKDLENLVTSVDGLFLESNYDPMMLENGHYPWFLKRRISGPGGHISNREAGELVAKAADSRLQWLCLAHLSAKNNSKQKAMNSAREILGKKLPIQVTSREKATESLFLGENIAFSGSSFPACASRAGNRHQLAFDF